MKTRLLTSVILIGFLCVVAERAAAAETKMLSELSAMRQALVSAGLGAVDARYHARAEGEGFLLASPAQQLTASLRDGAVEVRGSSGAVGMRLLGLGCESAFVAASSWRAHAEANRVDLEREGITEWYVAGPLGVEHGFTIDAPATGCETAAELVVELAVAGSASLSDDRRSIDFPEAGLRYRGLVVVDAAGRELPAHFELAGQRLGIRTEIAGALWPVTVDPTFESAKLLASDGAAGDLFSRAVAVSGSTVVVGAWFDGDNGVQSGSAFVFTEPDGGWAGTLNEVAKLLASDGAAGDWLGVTVAVSGSTIVVAAAQDDDKGDASGSAYVYTEPSGGWSGTLTEDAKLLASDGFAEDLFGGSVAVSGSTIVVGASGDDDDRGSAYVYTEPGGGWSGTLTEDAKLLASDGGALDSFGGSAAVSGKTVIVGAPRGGTGGSVYVFTEPVGGWTGTLNEDATLVASDTASEDFFGSRLIGISGTTVAVGAPQDDDNGAQSGSVYVFARPGGGWSGTVTETAKLLASDGDPGDVFGLSVAISGSSVVVGSLHDNGDDTLGTVYQFVEPPGGWAGILTEDARLLPSDGALADDFGFSVAMSDHIVVVGNPLADASAGSAYIFFFGIFVDGFESGDSSAWTNTIP